MTEIGSIAWYADRLGSEHASLTRHLTSLYADTAHTFTVERVDRQLSERTSAVLHEEWSRTEHRLLVWALDSSLWTIEEYRAGRYTYALRGFIQATGYYAQLGKQPDHMICLRNAFEALTDYVVNRETDCRCGVRRIVCHNDTIGSHDIRLRDKQNLVPLLCNQSFTLSE